MKVPPRSPTVRKSLTTDEKLELVRAIEFLINMPKIRTLTLEAMAHKFHKDKVYDDGILLHNLLTLIVNNLVPGPLDNNIRKVDDAKDVDYTFLRQMAGGLQSLVMMFLVEPTAAAAIHWLSLMPRPVKVPFNRFSDKKISDNSHPDKSHSDESHSDKSLPPYAIREPKPALTRAEREALTPMGQLSGLKLDDWPMKIGNVFERSADDPATVFGVPATKFGKEEEFTLEWSRGFGPGASDRLELLAKLAKGTGIQLPYAAVKKALKAPIVSQSSVAPVSSPPTQCFMLPNIFMIFDLKKKVRREKELRDFIAKECQEHGGLLDISIKWTSSQECNVYVKCTSPTAAEKSVNALHGRFFSGRVMKPVYVALDDYTVLYPPDSVAKK